jgi:hypothetical protein
MKRDTRATYWSCRFGLFALILFAVLGCAETGGSTSTEPPKRDAPEVPASVLRVIAAIEGYSFVREATATELEGAWSETAALRALEAEWTALAEREAVTPSTFDYAQARGGVFDTELGPVALFVADDSRVEQDARIVRATWSGGTSTWLEFFPADSETASLTLGFATERGVITLPLEQFVALYAEREASLGDREPLAKRPFTECNLAIDNTCDLIATTVRTADVLLCTLRTLPLLLRFSVVPCQWTGKLLPVCAAAVAGIAGAALCEKTTPSADAAEAFCGAALGCALRAGGNDTCSCLEYAGEGCAEQCTEFVNQGLCWVIDRIGTRTSKNYQSSATNSLCRSMGFAGSRGPLGWAGEECKERLGAVCDERLLEKLGKETWKHACECVCSVDLGLGTDACFDKSADPPDGSGAGGAGGTSSSDGNETAGEGGNGNGHGGGDAGENGGAGGDGTGGTGATSGTGGSGAIGAGGAADDDPEILATADSHNDPHLRTFDGVAYDLQSPGEFVLVEPTDASGTRIQARHEHLAEDLCPNVTLNTALAFTAGNARVGIYANEPVHVWIDGAETPLVAGMSYDLGVGASLVARSASSWQVRWPDGARLSVARVPRSGEHHLDFRLEAPKSWKNRTRGLFGTLDGVTQNDLVTRENDVLEQPLLWAELYQRFANSYRITPKESLFDYFGGRTPESYQVSEVPSAPALAAALPPALLAGAEAICDATGVTDATLRNACLLDVACAGGDPSQANWVQEAEPPSSPLELTYDPAFIASHCSSLSLPHHELVEVLTVPSDGSTTTSSLSLDLDTRYKIRASGTFSGSGSGDERSDAEYAHFEFPPALPLDLCTNGIDHGLAVDSGDGTTKIRWGSYCASHAYTGDVIGSGAPLVASYQDCDFAGNTGSLTLEIFAPRCDDTACSNLSGTRPEQPGRSCEDIVSRGDSVGSGSYWLEAGGPAFLGSCEMSIDGGGWTRLTEAIAGALDPDATKTYLYLYEHRWYRSPPTLLSWSWSTGQELTGDYEYFDGVTTSSYTCNGSSEKPGFGIGCSNGPGGLPKTLPIYTKDPPTGTCTVCQDAPFAFGSTACQNGVAVFVR